jgi:catechol 2,3-dioxygenase-like lactoylglutathione lyase family enzyme
MTMRYRAVVILVRDLSRSRAFYEGVLEQVVEEDYGQNVVFRGGLSIWEREHAWQMMHGAPPDAEPGACEWGELYFETDHLADVLNRLRDEGVELVHPVREQPWGQRVLRARDPDGHMVEVGEPMEVVIARFLADGLSPSAVAERTSMPLGAVNQVAQREA